MLWGSTALEYAARGGLSSVLQELIKKGAPLNSRNKKGETALLVAAREDETDAVRVLVEAGAEVDIQREDGARPLSVAVALGSEKAVRLLLRVGADPNIIVRTSQQSPLMTATVNRHVEICQHLLAYGADTTVTFDHGRTCLHLACHKGYANICSALLEAGASVNRRDHAGATPLCLATKNNRKHIGGQLIRYGADTSPVAFFDGVIKGLVAPFKPQLPLDLVKAVREGQADVVKKHSRKEEWWRFLAVRGVDTSLTCDCFGHTLLHISAIEGHHHIIDILLDMGAKVDCRTVAGLTPLRCSVDGGHLEATKRLIARGADVSSADCAGETCLMRVKDLLTAKELLAAGADASAVDASGANALHHLARVDNNVGPVICALVQAGARPDLLDKEGRTPADVGQLANHLDLNALLVKLAKLATRRIVTARKVGKGGRSSQTSAEVEVTSCDVKCTVNDTVAAQTVRSEMPRVEVIESEERGKKRSCEVLLIECEPPQSVLPVVVESPEIWSPPPPAGISLSSSASIVDAGARIGEEGFSFAGFSSSGGAGGFALGVDSSVATFSLSDAGASESVIDSCTDLSSAPDIEGELREAGMSTLSSETLPMQGAEPEARKRRRMKNKVRPCARCGTVTHRRCAGCKQTFYCSRDCMRAAWKDHKGECLAMQDQLTVNSSD